MAGVSLTVATAETAYATIGTSFASPTAAPSEPPTLPARSSSRPPH